MSTARSLAVVAVLALTPALTVACGRHTVEPSGTDAPQAVYQVRGVVRAVAEDGLQIRHEAIPGFRDASGEMVGMQAMSMDFALAPGVSSEGLQPGDKVVIALRVDWDVAQPAQIDSVEILPADTALEF